MVPFHFTILTINHLQYQLKLNLGRNATLADVSEKYHWISVPGL